MKELNFLQAINDIDDRYLLEADRAPARRPRLLSRIAAAAAIMTLLCVSAYAAFTQVSIFYQPETATFVSNGVEYFPQRITFDLEPVPVADAALEEMTQRLEEYKDWSIKNRAFTFTMNSRFFTADWHYYTLPERLTDSQPQPIALSSLEEAEAYLGIRLYLPAVARDSELDDRGLRTTVLTGELGADPDEAEQQLKAGADISPQLLELGFGSVAPTGDIGLLNTYVYLALTDEEAMEPFVLATETPQALLGDPHTEEIVIDGQTYTIRTYYPNEHYTGEVTVCYVRDGIGYQIIANVAEGSRITDPRDLLLPWLENMG